MTGRTRADVRQRGQLRSQPGADLARLSRALLLVSLIGGQYIIPALSDPLGRGLDLFGTADYRPDIGVVSPCCNGGGGGRGRGRALVAVALAHVTALRFYGSRRLALLSQIPMLVLMVGYTMLSLWILSQPIVETASAG
jgi:hypothetical protein